MMSRNVPLGCRSINGAFIVPFSGLDWAHTGTSDHARLLAGSPQGRNVAWVGTLGHEARCMPESWGTRI